MYENTEGKIIDGLLKDAKGTALTRFKAAQGDSWASYEDFANIVRQVASAERTVRNTVIKLQRLVDRM